MTISKKTLKTLDSAISTVTEELVKYAKTPGSRGAANAFYELRQSLLILTKSRAAFEPEQGDLASATSEPIGFDVESEEFEEESEDDEADTYVPEAKQIGFRPRS